MPTFRPLFEHCLVNGCIVMCCVIWYMCRHGILQSVMTSSNRSIFHVTLLLCGEPLITVDSPHKGTIIHNKLKNVINKHKSNKIKENSNTVRHLNNGTDHRHSKSCCDQSSPARRTITRTFDISLLAIWTDYWANIRLAGNWDAMTVTWRRLSALSSKHIGCLFNRLFRCRSK